MKRHVLEKIYESDYMPSSYLLVMPYASGSGGNRYQELVSITGRM